MNKIRLLLTVFLISAVVGSYGQDGESEILEGWFAGGGASFNVTQTALSNWNAGGVSSLSGVINGNLFGNYKKGKQKWDNRLIAEYGLQYLAEDEFAPRKFADLIDITSNYGYSFKEDWYASLLFNFKSQFIDGFNYSFDAMNNEIETRTSSLFAPAYILVAPGVEYKPNNNFNMLVSPATSKFTIVADEVFRNQPGGAFGVDSGDVVRGEFGASVLVNYQRPLTETINFTTNLGVFSNYLENPERVDVDWKVGITASLWKVISLSLNTHLIYDWDVAIINDEGIAENGKVQFKEVLGIGIGYTFDNLKK